MRTRMFLVGLMLLIAGTPACADVTISAAISLKGVLEKARPALEKAAGEPVRINYGASGALAGQIRQGAPVDLFFSADRANIDRLKNAKLLVEDSITVIAGNELVLVVPKEPRAGISIRSFDDLIKPEVQRIAIGEPHTVPAGGYAVDILKGLGLYDTLDKSGKIVMGDNVARVLSYVATGNVDAGLVYATDAKASDKIVRIARVPDKSHAPIRYFSAVIKASGHLTQAAAIQKSIQSDGIRNIFTEAGFLPPAYDNTGAAVPAAHP